MEFSISVWLYSCVVFYDGSLFCDVDCVSVRVAVAISLVSHHARNNPRKSFVTGDLLRKELCTN